MASKLRHIRELSTKWQMRFYDAKRNPTEKTFHFDKDSFNRRQIKRKRDDLRYQWQNGDWDPWSGFLPGQEAPKALTLRGAIDAYCAHKKLLGQRGLRGGWNKNTHQDYSLELKLFARRTGPHKLIATLSSEEVEDFLFDASVRPATQSKRRRMLKTFLNWSSSEGLIDAVPKLPPPFIEPETIPEYYTEQEMEIICETHVLLCKEHAAKPRVPKRGPNSPLALLWKADCWRFAFYQGLRRNELLAMRVRLVDLERNHMFVGDAQFIPKGKDHRIITLTPPARDIVRPYMKNKSPSDKVWPGCQPDRLSKSWKAALREAIRLGYVPIHKEKLDMHDLRDSCCNYWLNDRDVPIRRVQELLRHKSVRTTERFYKSTNVEAQTAAFERVIGK